MRKFFFALLAKKAPNLMQKNKASFFTEGGLSQKFTIQKVHLCTYESCCKGI